MDKISACKSIYYQLMPCNNKIILLLVLYETESAFILSRITSATQQNKVDLSIILEFINGKRIFFIFIHDTALFFQHT